MLENDLREMFEWQASADQPSAQISFPVARRRALIRRRWRRFSAIGAPVVAAAAAVAIGVTATAVSGAAGIKPAPTRPESVTVPQRFNPLQMYAAFGWLPPGGTLTGGDSYPTALALATSSGIGLLVYSAGQCALTATRLTCGSQTKGTPGAMTVTGRAPDVNGRIAYWGREIDEYLDEAATGLAGNSPMLAFQYGRGGWALLICSDQATAMRIAENVRFGHLTPIKFLVRLTGLPRQWRTVQLVMFVRNNLPMHADQLLLGQPPANVADVTPRSLSLFVHVGNIPACGNGSCEKINGYQITQFHSAEPVSGGETVPSYYLTANRPGANSLELLMTVSGPHPPLSPVEVFTDHVQMLSPNPASWTTTPISP